MKKIPHVVIIVLNNNRCNDTLACLTSLRQATYKNQSIVVLDNASQDGSVEAIHISFPEVQVIELTENRGYAGNNNVGLRTAAVQQADWVLVLNDDTILDPDCVTRMVEIGEHNQEIGMIGPMIYHFNEPEVIQSAGGFLDHQWESGHLGQNELDQGQFAEPHLVDWVSGCAILVRRTVIEQIGVLDEQFFCYWEEVDWCLRARQAGWLITQVPQAKLWHKGVQRDYQPKPYVTYYVTRNWFLLLTKHHAPLSAWTFAWRQTLRTLLSWTIKPKWRFMREHRNAMWHGVLDFLCHRSGAMSS